MLCTLQYPDNDCHKRYATNTLRLCAHTPSLKKIPDISE